MRLRPLLLLALSCLRLSAVDWHHPLYLGRGGYWQQRVPVTIHNGAETEVAGKAVAVVVGSKPGQAPLVGARVEADRKSVV